MDDLVVGKNLDEFFGKLVSGTEGEFIVKRGTLLLRSREVGKDIVHPYLVPLEIEAKTTARIRSG